MVKSVRRPVAELRLETESGESHAGAAYGDGGIPDLPFGTCRLERFELADGLLLHLSRMHFREETELEIGNTQPPGTISLMACATGVAHYDVNGCSGVFSSRDNVAMHLPEQKGVFSIMPGKSVRAVGICLREETTECRLGFAPPEAMKRLLHTTERTVLHFETRPEVRQLCAMMTDSSLEGETRRLHPEGTVNALLAIHCDAIRQSGLREASRTIAERDRYLARAAQAFLISRLAKPPTLEEVAGEVGMAPRRLNDVFHQVYGETVAGFVRNARLDEAARRIRTERISIKQAAWDAGYRHVANFTRAFQSRFGRTPGDHSRQP
ncbi:AraC family transcriptional regulator [uncultured Nitratireductor sp.]|uniref:helix-turn-helix domain-containing protein n=1 Tax=uncultured Nitratireductor sp. TaxID=520953 RepID=UPI0025EDA5A8|nr:AraC family transcriptional regulator [uncultured Nitratireductor sp.]